MILEPGGRQSEWETMSTFLGREPNLEAFYNKYGWDTPVQGQL
jgi:Zn-dependent oligopeptidase